MKFASGIEVPARYSGRFEGHPFAIELEISAEAGRRPACEAITIRRTTESPGLTTEALRQVPVKRLVGRVTTAVAELAEDRWHDRESPIPDLVHPAPAAEVAAALTASEGSQRADAVDAGKLAMVARIVGQARLAGDPHPTQRVREHFHISRQTARRYIRRAIELGLLTDAVRGEQHEQ